MEKAPMKRFSVRMDARLYANAQEVAREQGVSCQALMRDLIRGGLASGPAIERAVEQARSRRTTRQPPPATTP